MSKSTVINFTLFEYDGLCHLAPADLEIRYSTGTDGGYFKLSDARVVEYWKILAPMLEEDRQNYLRSIKCDPEKY